MNEHTLDDLAARLAALGLLHAEDSPRSDYLEMWIDDLPIGDLESRDASFIMYRATDGHLGVDGPLLPETWPILDAIRQWQASAEPAPPEPEWVKELMAQPVTLRPSARRSFPEDMEPPAAPVVTSDGIDLDWLRTDLKRYGWTRSVSQLLKTEYWSRGNNQIRFEPYGPVLNGAPVTHPEVVKTIRSIWRAAGIGESALRGADLAPEGARDAVRG